MGASRPKEAEWNICFGHYHRRHVRLAWPRISNSIGNTSSLLVYYVCLLSPHVLCTVALYPYPRLHNHVPGTRYLCLVSVCESPSFISLLNSFAIVFVFVRLDRSAIAPLLFATR